MRRGLLAASLNFHPQDLLTPNASWQNGRRTTDGWAARLDT